MACTPEQLIQDAQTYCCLPPNTQIGIQNYILARIRGGSMNVDDIIKESSCVSRCIPPGLMPRIKTWLLCQLSNVGGETPIPPYPECDADAQAFITAAGLTDETQIGAVCVLVRDLKTYPAVGTKYWDRDVLIYPFVGGNAAAHAVNLKNPGGANDITWFGAGFTHNGQGVKSDASAGTYGSTQYVIPAASVNAFRGMMYLDLNSTIANSRYYGCSGVDAFWPLRFNLTFSFQANSTTTSFMPSPLQLGMQMIQRYEAATQKGVFGSNAWSSFNVLSTGTSTAYINLFCYNIGGVPPIGAPNSLSDCRVSSFSFGAPMDTLGGNAEHLEYKGIWDAFNSTLGRGHP